MPRQWKGPTCGQRVLLAKSCSNCGELKMASEFPIQNGMYYHAWCNECRVPLVKETRRKISNDSIIFASKSGQEWTSSEIEKLEKLTDARVPIKEIARQLGRSYNAVSNRKALLKE